jgi:hypothetical protein
MSPAELRPDNDCAGEAAAIVNDSPIIPSERMILVHEDYKCQVFSWKIKLLVV